MDLSNWGEFKKPRKADSQLHDPNTGLVGLINKHGLLSTQNKGKEHIMIMLGALKDHLALSFN